MLRQVDVAPEGEEVRKGKVSVNPEATFNGAQYCSIAVLEQ